MIIINFFYGLSFSGLGLAAYLQLRRGDDFPLRKLLPWLAAFGFAGGATGWIETFMVNEANPDTLRILENFYIVLQPVSGLLLLFFGWGIFARLIPLPAWTIFIPGILVVPFAYVITYAMSTFVTPSPIKIPIDIWSRYLLYLPGSVLAGLGFLRQWRLQQKLGYSDVAKLMLGAGVAFLIEAFVMGLIVPAAPYGPASYYNYDRVLRDAFTVASAGESIHYGLTAWLDYQRVLEVTGLPIQFWRLLSAVAVTFFVIRGLDVFDAIRKRELQALQIERDKAQNDIVQGQILARQTAERWTEALVGISRKVAELEDVDDILLHIVASARELLKSDFIGIGLLDEQYSKLELKAFSTNQRTALVDSNLFITNPLILNTILTLKSYRSINYESPEMLVSLCPVEDIQANEVIIVPLTLENNRIGALWVARCGKNDFQESYSETDLIWLECLADQVVIAIKHGVMTAQLQSLSVIEERARIAREMHDGLAQILGYLNLQVQTLEALLNQGKEQMLLSELKQMRTSIQLAHGDVRENILSLRTTLNHEKGLVSAISEYLEEFSIQTGVKVEFINHVKDGLNISSIAEVQLVCILQEALANVRKHSKAYSVKVFLSKEPNGDKDFVILSIDDDGVGFTITESKRSFGIETMKERAQSVNGKLTVTSTQGDGAYVHCKLPCLYHEKL